MNEHPKINEQCPRCGHNYFQKGSGICHYCIEELTSKESHHTASYSEDPDQWYQNCLPHMVEKMSVDKRKQAAKSLGPNWANIISGLGDQ